MVISRPVFSSLLVVHSRRSGYLDLYKFCNLCINFIAYVVILCHIKHLLLQSLIMIRKLQIQTFVGFFCIALIFVTFFASIPKAVASASGCTSSGSCVYVNGEGTMVEYGQGGVKLSIRARVYGHTEVWGSASGRDLFHRSTQDKDFFNSSYLFTKNIWDTQGVYYRKDMPEGAKVCSQFWKRIGGDYQNAGIACVTISK